MVLEEGLVVTGRGTASGGEGMHISTVNRLRMRDSFGGVVMSLTGGRNRIVS